MIGSVPRTAVYMLVRNECTHDVRVLKEADALARRGMRVTIVAVQRNAAAAAEKRGPVTILRVPIRPLHYRLLYRYRAAPRVQMLLIRRARSRRIAENVRTRHEALRALERRRALALREAERALRDRLEREAQAIRACSAGGSAPEQRAALIGRSLLPLAPRATVSIGPAGRVRLAAVAVHSRKLRARTQLWVGRPTVRHAMPDVRPPVQRGRAAPLALAAAKLANSIRDIPAHTAHRIEPIRDDLRVGGFAVDEILIRGLRPVGRARSWIRDPAYRVLQRSLMYGHRQFLLLDYTIRALRTVKDDLATVTECGQRGEIVIHAHDLNTLVPGVLAQRRLNAGLVYDSHELQNGTTAMIARGRVQRRMYRLYERILARRADAVVAVSESIARIMERDFGITSVDVVRNTPVLSPPLEGHDLLRAEIGIAPERRIALYHGNLASGRGLEVLVESAALMDGIDVVLLGSGPLATELSLLAERSGVADRVHVLPAVPQSVLHRYVASADIGVVPIQASVPNYYYSLPNKLFDVLMAGIPVAASHVPEIRRVVEQERVGAIFDPEDPGDMAQKITSVLSSPDYDEMCQRALRSARTRHNWSQDAERLAGVYARVASRHDR